MVNSIIDINSRLQFSFWDEPKLVYRKQIKDVTKLCYKNGKEYKAIDFDKPIAYHRIVGSPTVFRSNSAEIVYNYPMRLVMVAELDCVDPEYFLMAIGQSAVKDVESVEIRTETVKSEEGIGLKDNYTAIYVNYNIRESIKRGLKRIIEVPSDESIHWINDGNAHIVTDNKTHLIFVK